MLAYTEESLVSYLKLRDPNAIRFAYKKYAPALYGIIYKHSPENVDEIFQKTFIQIVASVDNYDPANSRLFTWMYWIVMNELSEKRFI